MSEVVLLLRGINVGGRHVLPMKELVRMLEDLGCRDVRTYIQSGNVVLEAPAEVRRTLGRDVQVAIEESKGFRPELMVLRGADVKRAMDRNPFPEGEAEPKTLHVGFCATAPKGIDEDALAAVADPSERFAVDGKVVYLHCPAGLGRSKLAAAFERALGVPMTLRNWRTMMRISELLGAT